MKPLLRWVGGKSALVSTIRAHVPRACKRYVEPFMGSAAVFFHLAYHYPTYRNALLSDACPHVVELHRAVRDSPRKFCEQLRAVERWLEHNGLKEKSAYEEVREALNATPPEQAAPYSFYINRTCFNGLWRVNADGLYNVPYGKRPFRWTMREVYLAASLLHDAVLTVSSAFDVLASCREGDVVYLDPPYDASDFTSYTVAGFSDQDQERLAVEAARAVDRGAHVVASNSNTERVRSLWASFSLHQPVAVAETVAASAEARGRRKELLMVGKP